MRDDGRKQDRRAGRAAAAGGGRAGHQYAHRERSVARLTVDRVRQFFGVWTAVDELATKQIAICATATQPKALAYACPEIESANEHRDAACFIAATNTSNYLILEESGNKDIHAVLNSLKVRPTYLRILALTQDDRGSHSNESSRRAVATLRTPFPGTSRDASVRHLAVKSNIHWPLRDVVKQWQGVEW